MRLSDLALIIAAVGTFAMAVEDRGRLVLTATEQPVVKEEKVAFITCPLRKPDFATVMQAAMLGDGTLIVEQQTNTRVRHIKDC